MDTAHISIPRSSILRSIVQELRAHAATWIITAMLPLPILLAGDPASSAEIACLYLGSGCAWLAMELYRAGGLSESTRAWAVKVLAIFLAVATNVALFIGFGIAGGVQSHFPFPLMAALSALPAIGIMPWLIRRLHKPYLAMLAGALAVFGAKLAACVVARVVYGPDYIEQGYVSADWRSAKLMITLFWSATSLLSLSLLFVERVNCKPRSAAKREKEIDSLVSTSPH